MHMYIYIYEHLQFMNEHITLYTMLSIFASDYQFLNSICLACVLGGLQINLGGA